MKRKSKIEAFKEIEYPLSNSSAYRLWAKFLIGQSKIRNLLTQYCPAPDIKESSEPAFQTIVHLEKAFSSSTCPIEAFQYQFQTSFI